MDGLKKLFQGKKGKFFIAAIVVVAILGFVAYRRKAAATNTSVVEGFTPTEFSGSGGSGSAGSSTPDVTREDVVGLFSSYTSVVQDALKQQADQNKGLAESMNSALAYQQSGFNQTIAGINSSLGDLSSTVNESLLSGAQYKLLYGSQQPTYDDNGYGGFNLPATATGQGAITDLAASSGFNTPAAAEGVKPSNVVDLFGKGGIDYNAKTTTANDRKAIQENEARLKNDAEFKESEKVRAAQVIKERKAAGMDTSAQETYLKKLG